MAAVFVLIGVLGFIPGVTTHYGDLTFAGHHSEAKLLGLFQVSILHNLLHLLFGLVGLVLARRVAGARLFLAGGGAVYLGLWLYGFAIDRETAANFVPVNDADNWLHLFLGFGMLALGLLLSNDVGHRRPAGRPPRPPLTCAVTRSGRPRPATPARVCAIAARGTESTTRVTRRTRRSGDATVVAGERAHGRHARRVRGLPGVAERVRLADAQRGAGRVRRRAR